MCKEQNVLNYYVVCNKLKNVIRTGWKDWKVKRERIERIFLEFDAHKTAEAKFAYMCDKLECDLQCKLYDEEGCVDLNDQEDNETAANSHVKALLESEKTWSGMWLKFGQEKYPYDENFMAVSKYAMKNTLSRCIKSTTVI